MPRARIALAGLFCSSVLISCAYGLSSGQYYIQVAQSGLCNNEVSYLAFKNTTCGSKAGPTIRSGEGSMGWKKWTVSIIKSASDGSFKAKISNYYKTGTVQCVGSIAVGNSALCSEASADKVSLRTKGSIWRLVPVASKSDTYQIVAEERGDSCLRYLGADCSEPYVSLFAKDGATASQWTFKLINPSPALPRPSPTPSPPPSPTPIPSASFPPPPDSQEPPQAPGGINSVFVGETMWFVTWEDASSKAIETSSRAARGVTYTLKCTLPGSGCKGADIGNTVTGIPPGVRQGAVTGLEAGSSLECYVIAVNSYGSTCSAPIAVNTQGGIEACSVQNCLKYDSKCGCTMCNATSIPHCTKYDSSCACTECEVSSYPSYVLDAGICRTYAPLVYDHWGFSDPILMCTNDTYSECYVVGADAVIYNVRGVVRAFGKYYIGSDRSGTPPFYAFVTVCDEFDPTVPEFSGCTQIESFGSVGNIYNFRAIFAYENYIYLLRNGDTWLYVCKDAGLQDCQQVDTPGMWPTAINVVNSKFVLAGSNANGQIRVCDDPLLSTCKKYTVGYISTYNIATDGKNLFIADWNNNNGYLCNERFQCSSTGFDTAPLSLVWGAKYFNGKLLLGSYNDGFSSAAVVCQNVNVTGLSATADCALASGIDADGLSHVPIILDAIYID